MKSSPDESHKKYTVTWYISAITDAFLDQKRTNVQLMYVKLAYQFIVSSKHSPGINLRYLHLIFLHPLHPSPPSLTTPWWHFPKTLMCCHHYHVFTYIYSLLIEKGICDRQNISSFHVFVWTLIRRSLHFLVGFPFFSLCIVLSVLRYFPFHLVIL